MEIIGIENNNYIIKINNNNNNIDNNNIIIKRNYNDFHKLSKLINIQFPSFYFKKLLNNSDNNNWNIIDNNYSLYIIKSLNYCNRYLNEIDKLLLEKDKEIFINDNLFELQKQERIERKELESYSRELQQYFMSKDNINQIISIVLF